VSAIKTFIIKKILNLFFTNMHTKAHKRHRHTLSKLVQRSSKKQV